MREKKRDRAREIQSKRRIDKGRYRTTERDWWSMGVPERKEVRRRDTDQRLLTSKTDGTKLEDQ